MKALFKGQLQDLKKLQKYQTKQISQQKTLHKKAVQSRPSAVKGLNITPEDRQAFFAATRGVTPLPQHNKHDHMVPSLRHSDYFKHKRESATGEFIDAAITPVPKIKIAIGTSIVQPEATPINNRSIVAIEKAASPAWEASKRCVRPQTKLTHGIYDHEKGTYIRDTHAVDLLKKLQRGQWAVESTLDLHGATQVKAAARFDHFMSTCIMHNLRCVLIVHGQGHGSKGNKPVLKECVKSWLRELPQVAAFKTAPDNMGGEGAVIVLLT